MLNSLYPTTRTLPSRFIAASITNTGQIPPHTHICCELRILFLPSSSLTRTGAQGQTRSSA